MAYYEEEPLDQTQMPVGGSAQPAGGASASQQAASPVAPNAPGGMPSNFVNINQYLNANKNQSGKLAEKVGGYVDNLGNTARSTLDSSQKSFNDDVNQGTVNFDQGLFDQAKTRPQDVASDQQKKQQFQTMRDATYKGPSSFQGAYYQPAYTQAKKATDTASMTDTVGGQRELLSQMQKDDRGRVNQGALAFDSALLQTAPNAKETLAEARARQEGLMDLVESTRRSSDTKAQQAAQTTANTRNQVAQTFGNQALQKQIEQALRKNAEEQSKKAMADAQKTIEALSFGNKLDNSQLQYLGISPEDLKYIQDNSAYTFAKEPFSMEPRDLSPYTSTQVMNIDPRALASSEDYAKYAALNDLMGDSASYLSDPSLAGTASMDALQNFDMTKFRTNAEAEKFRRAQIQEQERLKALEAQRLKEQAAAAAVATAPSQTPGLEQTATSEGAKINQGPNMSNAIGSPLASAVSQSLKAPEKAYKSVQNTLKRWSDKRLKTDVKPFDSYEFLERMG